MKRPKFFLTLTVLLWIFFFATRSFLIDGACYGAVGSLSRIADLIVRGPALEDCLVQLNYESWIFVIFLTYVFFLLGKKKGFKK